MRPLVPRLQGLVVATSVVEERNPFCSSDCCSCLIVIFPKCKPTFLDYVILSVSTILVDASLQIICVMNCDAMFISTDKVLVCKITQHFIDALTGSPDHCSNFFFCQPYINPSPIFNFNPFSIT